MSREKNVSFTESKATAPNIPLNNKKDIKVTKQNSKNTTERKQTSEIIIPVKNKIINKPITKNTSPQKTTFRSSFNPRKNNKFILPSLDKNDKYQSDPMVELIDVGVQTDQEPSYTLA